MTYDGICACNCCGIITGVGCLPKRKLAPQKNRICNVRLIFFDLFMWSKYGHNI
jgi:hypothetical protein